MAEAVTRRQPKRQRDPRHAIAYLRVSTDRQDLGVDAQRAAIEAWAKLRDVQIDVWHEDRVSGGAEIADRPALVAALAELQASGAGVFVVAKRDRLARDTTNAGLITRQVERCGAVVVSADGVGDGADPASRMLAGIMDVFAEFERGTIRARTTAALRVLRRRGAKFNGTAPYGWRVTADDMHLERDDEEGAAVALAVTLRRDGMAYRYVCGQLAKNGFLPRSGVAWHPHTVARIVKQAEVDHGADSGSGRG